MTPENLLDLARVGIESHEHRLVLADVVEETGWWDERIKSPLSNDGDRAEFLALLTWPGETGEHCARVMVEAMTTPKRIKDT